MISSCDLVAERVALGEPLGDLAEHAASCVRCRRLAALPTELAGARQTADPGLGFSARITAGAQRRLVVRKRQRVAIAFAGMVAAAAAAVVVVTREPEPASVAIDIPRLPQPAVRNEPSHQHDPWDPDGVDPDARDLVRLARGGASHYHEDWDAIEKPLAPYRSLLKGVEP